jgi:hypothetical protein
MHRAAARFRLLGIGIALATAGCGRPAHNAPATFTSDGLRFFAAARVNREADSLLISVTARNDAATQRVIQGGMCGDPLVLRVYREPVPRRHPSPAWDSGLWRRETDPPNRVCLPVAILQVLAPGDSTAVAALTVPVRAVLGDSLPATRYRVRAEYHGTLDAGIVELHPPPA